MTQIPIVLVTPDIETRAGRRGPYRCFTLDESYATAVQVAGGLPLVAPYSEDEAAISALLDECDGLLLSGGDFDVDPALFGALPHPRLGTLKADRTRFELSLLRGAVARSLPILGVCGGMQLMNVERGGTLWQDLPSERPESLDHQQSAAKHLAGHEVVVSSATLLAQLSGNSGPLGVNSTHHQAVHTLGAGLVASAIATDGVIEAIEDPALAFFLGVQWHPEAMPQEASQRALYRGLVAAARARAAQRTRRVFAATA